MRVARLFVVGFALLMILVAPGRAKAQAVAFQPGIGVLNDGVSLNVTPVVTADRRYVRLTLAPEFQAVTGLSNFPVPGAVSNGGMGLGGLGGGGLGGLGGGGLGGLGGGGGGGFRSVMGPADFAAWYPDLGIPYADNYVSRLPKKPLQARTGTGRSKKPEPDPVIVPIKKGEKGGAGHRG